MSALPPILVADDDANDLFLIRRRLDKAGVKHPIVTFSGGEELVSFLRASCVLGARENGLRPGLLFVDVRMPGMGGFDVLRWVRRQKALKELPIVVLSSSDEPKDIARALELGATEYYTKLPSVEEMAKLVQRLVK